jgi:hypothetical protein
MPKLNQQIAHLGKKPPPDRATTLLRLRRSLLTAVYFGEKGEVKRLCQKINEVKLK